MVEKKYTNGLEAVNRVRLLMQYSLEKTLSENITELSVLNEQYYVAPKFPYTTTSNAPKVPAEMQKIINKQGLKTQLLSPRPETSKNNWEKDKKEYQSENPDMVWDPNAYDTTRPSLDKNGKTTYPKGNWVKMTPLNIGLRGTPFGFAPSEYPEYLTKVAQIKEKYPRKEDSVKKNLELLNLRSQYYHQDYPEGITRADFIKANKGKANLNAEKIKSLKALEDDSNKNPYQTIKTNPGSDYFLDVKNKQISQEKMRARMDIENKYRDLNDYFDIVFGRDPTAIDQVIEANKSDLEKRWEDWKGWLELAVWVGIDIFTESIALELTAARQGKVLAKTIGKIAENLKQLGPAEQMAKYVRFASGTGLPAAMGGYLLLKERKLTGDSLMWFVFAVLPFANKFFKSLKGVTTTKGICNRIVSQMSKYDLKDPIQLKTFIKTLSQEEKSLVRSVWTMSKQEMDEGIKKTIELIGKEKAKSLVNAIKSIGKGGITNPGLVKVAAKTVLHFAGILTAINLIDEAAIKLGVIADPKIIEEIKYKFHRISEEKKENPLVVTMAFFEIMKYFEEHKEISSSDEVINTVVRNTELLLKSEPEKVANELITRKTHYENLGLVNDSMLNSIPHEKILEYINNYNN